MELLFLLWLIWYFENGMNAKEQEYKQLAQERVDRLEAAIREYDRRGNQ